MKGISPLVAAVLLIAVTMTVAGLLAYWAASFVRTSLPAVNETEAQCRFADFKIYSCSYSNATKKLNLILENLKDIELKDLKVFIVYANNTVSDPIHLDGTLTGGALKSFSLSVTEEFKEITVKTHCPELTKTKACSGT